MAVISPTARVRRSPYHAATLEAGVRSFEIYNQMLMPTCSGWSKQGGFELYLLDGSRAGCDTDARTNPFEVRLGRFVDLDVPDDTIGIEALRRIAALGPERHQLGVVLEEDAPTARQVGRFDIRRDGVRVGRMTECVWSYRLQRTIGLVLVDIEAAAGAVVEVRLDDREVAGTLQALPFL